jgi:hypothetical protein
MSRLYRPTVPLEVKCLVALRQLGEMWPERVIDENRANPSNSYMARIGASTAAHRSLGRLLTASLNRLAELLGCNVLDLRLDHDPPLAARLRYRRGLGKKTYYQPDANDPDHLKYRPHGPQFDGSHLIKTNVRGDNGQFPDRVLIKRERRRQERKAKPKTAKKAYRAAKPVPNRADQWPPKGTRKLRSRPWTRP